MRYIWAVGDENDRADEFGRCIWFDEILAKEWRDLLNKGREPDWPLYNVEAFIFTEEEYVGALRALAIFGITPESTKADFDRLSPELAAH